MKEDGKRSEGFRGNWIEKRLKLGDFGVLYCECLTFENWGVSERFVKK